MAKIKLASFSLYYDGVRVRRGLKTKSDIQNAALNYLMNNPRLLKRNFDLFAQLQTDTRIKNIKPFTIRRSGGYSSDLLPDTSDIDVLFEVGKHFNFNENQLQASGENLKHKLPSLLHRDTKYNSEAFEKDSNIRLQISVERSKGRNLGLKELARDKMLVLSFHSMPNLRTSLGRKQLNHLYQLNLYSIGDKSEMPANEYNLSLLDIFKVDDNKFEYIELLDIINNGKITEQTSHVLGVDSIFNPGFHRTKEQCFFTVPELTKKQYVEHLIRSAKQSHEGLILYAKYLTRYATKVSEVVKPLRDNIGVSKRNASKIAWEASK